MANLRDSVMGIASRKEWYRLLSAKILEFYPAIQKWDTTKPHDLSSLLEDFDPTTPIRIIYGDISFLSYVNFLTTHNGGDKFLETVGKVLQPLEENPHVLPGRLGGDEIAIFVIGKKDHDLKVINRTIQTGLSNIVITEQPYLLTGHIDLGHAKIEEGVGVLQNYAKSLIKKQSPSTDERFSKKLVDIFVAIADRRSDIVKIRRRVRLLVNIWLYSPEAYVHSINFLRKGGNGVSDKQIETFANLKGDPAAFDRAIAAFSLSQKKTKTVLDQLIETEARQPFM